MNKPNLENSFSKKYVAVYILLAIVLAFSYSSLIRIDTILNYDDKLLLGPVQNIHSLSNYFEYVKKGIVADLQPMRDLSYWIDFKIKDYIPFYSFHFSNVFYWFLACILFHQILILDNCSPDFSLLFLLLLSISPVSSSSVAWIAARKHILSALFILLATFYSFKQKSSVKIIISFLLSILSQPINTLWPVWNYIHSKILSAPKRWLTLTLFGLTAASLTGNYFYYSVIYPSTFSSVNKFASGAQDGSGLMMLALGRYFYQCLNPFAALPTTHYQGSWENLVGLFLLLLFAIYCYSLDQRLKKRIISPLLFFIFPLLIVVFKRTNIFCSDTYVLTSCAGLYWAFAIIFSEKFNNKFVKGTLFFLIISIFIFNLKYVSLFQDEDALWVYSEKKEANSQSTAIVASILIQKKQFYDSFLLIKKLQEEWPEQPFIPQLIAENVFHNPGIKPEIKISTLENTTPKTTSTFLYLSILYGQNHSVEKLKLTLPKIFADKRNFNLEFHGAEEKVGAIFYYTCEFYNLENCQKTLNDFKMNLGNTLWNEKIFEDYMGIFKSSKEYGVR